MPLDHYVSQVHLKKFYSASLGGGMMHAMKKSDLKVFPCRSQDVCRIENGSTTPFLENERIVEEFLREYVEPKYNAAIGNLISDEIDVDCILAISGFTAYILTCSPTVLRTNVAMPRTMVEHTAAILDRRGALQRAPAALGNKTLTQLVQEGVVKISIDPKFVQANGVGQIVEIANIFGNSHWEILINDCLDSPFFTSDFPIGIEQSADPRVVNRVVPLAPYIAVRIHPDIGFRRGDKDFSFSRFSRSHRKISKQEVLSINRLLVRCAEDIVFYSAPFPWVTNFIAKNRNYRVNTIAYKMPAPDGSFHLFSQKLTPHAWSS
ncbi:MAG: DUF4238 domain-containing protein [Rhodospirillales bacterium]|nr:MAG: DUF4238 domain-containing protein [Rhodospirillales bacterium]